MVFLFAASLVPLTREASSGALMLLICSDGIQSKALYDTKDNLN